jgi:hypothetical protein
MAASPQWKVYQGKEYLAACKRVEEAACLVAFLGDGATIRAGHDTVLWTEGAEDQPAAESFDHVADVVHSRLDVKLTAARLRRVRGAA